jgi:hypothetical protein
MLIIFVLFIALLSSNILAEDNYGIEMIKLEAKTVESSDLNVILSDILLCSKEEVFTGKHGRPTQAHETVHGINAQVRNELFKKGRRNINALYAGKRKSIIVSNPSINIRHVSRFVPKVLRGNRYELYFINQLQYWDDVPTYLMDEWSAYVAGAECGVEDLELGLPKEHADIVCGALEFSIYCVALCAATKELDNDFWSSNNGFKESVKYYLIKSEKVFFKGWNDFKSDSQARLLNSLRTSEEASVIREMLIEDFEGIFIK